MPTKKAWTMPDTAEWRANAERWALARKVFIRSRENVCLFGPPGTGKTELAFEIARELGRDLYRVNCSYELPMAELRGHFILKGAATEWLHGIVTLAAMTGAICLIDEIDHSGPDARSFLHAVCDAKRRGLYTLPDGNGTTVNVEPEFRIIATMNGVPEDLGDALSDRFPVKLNMTGPNPSLVEALPERLRGFVPPVFGVNQGTAAPPPPRQLFAFQSMVDVGISELSAAQAILGDRAATFLNTLKINASKGIDPDMQKLEDPRITGKTDPSKACPCGDCQKRISETGFCECAECAKATVGA